MCLLIYSFIYLLIYLNELFSCLGVYRINREGYFFTWKNYLIKEDSSIPGSFIKRSDGNFKIRLFQIQKPYSS